MWNRTSTAVIAGMILAVGASCVPAEGADVAQHEAAATTTPQTALATGLIGVASGQYARLHVTRLHPPEPVDPFALSLALIDDRGTIVAERQVELVPGESAHLGFRGPTTAGARILLRAAIVGIVPPDDNVDGTDSPDDTLANGGIQATLEIVDTDGSSRVVMNPLVVKGFNPQPEPPAVTR